MGLTKADVDKATYDPEGKTWQVVMDDELKGFGLRLLGSGQKSFIVRYRNAEGKTRILTLGRYGPLTVKQARDMATAELGEVAKGHDPLEERQRERSAGLTLAEFWGEYLEDYAKKHRRSWRDDERRFEREIRSVIGSKQLWSVTQDDVRKIHNRIGKRAPVEANRVVELLRLLFNLAEDWKEAPEGFQNPARLAGKRKGRTGKGRVKRYREKSRTRWLKKEEVTRLMVALEEELDLYAASAIRLLLYTGLRKSELLAAKWEHFDQKRQELFVPDRKGDEAFTLPLNTLAVQELNSLPCQAGSPWVFPAPNDPSKHRADVKRQWDRVRERAGLLDIRLHDLRRTAGSWMAQAGVPLAWIQEVLGHQSPEVVRVYARLAEESGRAAVDTYAASLESVLNSQGDET